MFIQTVRCNRPAFTGLRKRSSRNVFGRDLQLIFQTPPKGVGNNVNSGLITSYVGKRATPLCADRFFFLLWTFWQLTVRCNECQLLQFQSPGMLTYCHTVVTYRDLAMVLPNGIRITWQCSKTYAMWHGFPCLFRHECQSEKKRKIIYTHTQ